jgi:prepilin-type N-terminal cleavage/methylation domain-containing protein
MLMVRKRGFTLVELLVAMAIISVLIGIIIPVIPKVRDSARRAVCQSNLRQIGIGIEGYQDDNREEFPRARYMPRPWLSGDEDPPLNVALADYLEPDSEVWACPGDYQVHTATYTDESGRERECGVSYTYTTGLSGQTYDNSFFARFLELQPSEVPVLHDYDGGVYELEVPEGRDPEEFQPTEQIDFFHSKRSYLYADGSVG